MHVNSMIAILIQWIYIYFSHSHLVIDFFNDQRQKMSDLVVFLVYIPVRPTHHYILPYLIAHAVSVHIEHTLTFDSTPTIN